MSDIKEQIQKYVELLPSSNCFSTTEAERRAGEFLVALSIITDMRHKLSDHKIRVTSLQSAVYAEELFKGTAKTMTENKVIAEAAKEYMTVREEIEGIDNDLTYLKSYYDVYMNAHLFFRQMSKGQIA